MNVKEFNISNNERFAITFSGYNESSASKENVFIWDILRNELIRGLAINKEEKFENFKWSNNNQFLGRLKKDLLIVYESPKMQMLLDTELNARHPIKDNIKDFYWFPNRSNIIAVSEKRTGAKLSETILQFFEIPSRRTFAASSLVGLEIASLQWHKNNTLLAILCKSPEKNPKWAVRIFQFDNNKLSYKSAHTALASEGVSYYSMTIKWMGNDLFVSAKFKENNLDTLSVFPYKVDKQTLKIVSWPLDKFIKNVKHSHFLPSSNGVHFLLACMDPSNSNNYGKVELYAVFDNSLNYCRTFEFTGSLENVKWDHSGRLFEVELSRKKDNEGLRFFDCEGNLVYDYADNTALNAVWRIRHIPILDRASEEEDINKNIKSVFKTYDEEDAEFLSEIDKVNRTQAKMMKNAFMSVIMKRRKAWEENSEEREKMHKVTPPVYLEHEFYIEEILKTEEITIEGNRNDF